MNDLLNYRIDKSTEIGTVLVQNMVRYLQSCELKNSDHNILHPISWAAINNLVSKYLMLAYDDDLQYIKSTHIDAILKGDYDDE